jgi:hypothetical protein
LDTRAGGGAPIAAGGARVLTVAGKGGVPASGVTAVAVNVTATEGQQPGYVRVFKTGTAQPAISTVDYAAHQAIANLTIVDLNPSGQFTIVNHSTRAVHVIVDVQGYFTAGAGSSLHPLTITRVLDTRTSGSGTPLAGQSGMTITLGGKAGVPGSGITMVAINVTATQPVAPGYLQLYSVNDSKPSTSNVDFVGGQTIANSAYVRVSDTGSLKIYNGSSAPVHVIVDIEGFGTSP